MTFFEYLSFLQSLDDVPSKNPWETTLRLQDNVVCEYEAICEHTARKKNYPPKLLIEKAYHAAIVQDDPGLYSDYGIIPDEDVDYHHEITSLNAINDIIDTVTDVNYQRPNRSRMRIPSGPYRIMTEDERDEITL